MRVGTMIIMYDQCPCPKHLRRPRRNDPSFSSLVFVVPPLPCHCHYYFYSLSLHIFKQTFFFPVHNGQLHGKGSYALEPRHDGQQQDRSHHRVVILFPCRLTTIVEKGSGKVRYLITQRDYPHNHQEVVILLLARGKD